MPESDTIVRQPTVTQPAPERLRTAFPLPREPGFGDFLIALDHGFEHPQAKPHRPHRGRPFRVLVLALFAVLLVLTFATAAAAAAWELAGERYVDEIVREQL